jgi:putative iron-regulated protein
MRFLIIPILLFANYVTHAATREEIVEKIARNVILQDYVDLGARTQDLLQTVRTLAAAPTQTNLELAQQAWRDARMPWETSEAFLFGPVSALGLDPSIDTWPVNKIDLQAVMNSGRALNIDFVRNLGANLQGFHTIEYLLFGEGTTAQKKTAAQLKTREIEYLLSTSALLAEKTEQLAKAWSTNANPDDPSTPGFVDIIGRPGPNNPSYPTAQAVLAEYVKGIIKILDEVANGKMSGPLGASIAAADPSLVESPFAWNSIADFANNLRSALYVYTGDYRATPGPGINDIIAASNPALAKQVENDIRTGIRKILDISGPNKIDFREAILDPEARLRIKAAIDHINALSRVFENQILLIVQK